MKKEVVIIRIESYFLEFYCCMKCCLNSVFMQIRCNFSNISYLSETQKITLNSSMNIEIRSFAYRTTDYNCYV